MRPENLPGTLKSLARVAPLLAIALACAGVACGDEAETVQQTETQQLEEQPEGQRPAMLEGPEGCYIQAQMRCDCALLEEDCSEDVGIWTDGCASCAAP